MNFATSLVLAVLLAIGVSIAVAVCRQPALIDGWHRSWRLTSNQAQAALAVFMLAQSDLVPHLRPLITEKWWPLVAVALSVAGIYLRVQAQPGVLQGASPDAPESDAERAP